MPLRSFALHTAFWILLSLGLSAYLHLAYDLDRSLGELALRQLITWITYAPLSWGAAILCRHLRTQSYSAIQALLFHAVYATIFAYAHSILVRCLDFVFALGEGGVFLDARRITWSYMVYGLVVVVFRAVHDRRELSEHHKNAIRNQRDLSDAKLSALEQQIQPHFLFNTLHAIALTCQEDPKRAESMVLLLSELLRSSLKKDGRPIIRLQEEIGHLTSFIEIQRHRFGDNLDVQINDIQDLGHFGVPFFAIQTLVENAFKHGIERNETSHQIRISCVKDGENLRVDVEDDGPGFAVEAAQSAGVGLSNVRKRLVVLYGDEASVETGKSSLKGAKVSLIWPARTPEDEV